MSCRRMCTMSPARSPRRASRSRMARSRLPTGEDTSQEAMRRSTSSGGKYRGREAQTPMCQHGNGAQQAGTALAFGNQKPQKHAQRRRAPLRAAQPTTSTLLQGRTAAESGHPTCSDPRQCVGSALESVCRSCRALGQMFRVARASTHRTPCNNSGSAGTGCLVSRTACP